jgi:hypothetical protein
MCDHPSPRAASSSRAGRSASRAGSRSRPSAGLRVPPAGTAPAPLQGSSREGDYPGVDKVSGYHYGFSLLGNTILREILPWQTSSRRSHFHRNRRNCRRDRNCSQWGIGRRTPWKAFGEQFGTPFAMQALHRHCRHNLRRRQPCLAQPIRRKTFGWRSPPTELFSEPGFIGWQSTTGGLVPSTQRAGR